MVWLVELLVRGAELVKKTRLFIQTHENGQDYYDTARVLGIARTTAWGIIRRYQLHGQVVRPRGGAWRRKVDQEMINELTVLVEAHPEYTLTQLKREMHENLPLKLEICQCYI